VVICFASDGPDFGLRTTGKGKERT
jgi:hypothetical protein